MSCITILLGKLLFQRSASCLSPEMLATQANHETTTIQFFLEIAQTHMPPQPFFKRRA